MRSSKEKYVKFILYILVIVLINIAGISLFFRADLTASKIYSLSPASRAAVASLNEPLSIKVFFSKDLPAPHNNTERYLKDLLEEYASQGGEHFNYSFYNVSIDDGTLMQRTDENRDMARNYGIEPIQIQILENDEVKFKNAYMGLVIIHGDLIEKIEAITSTDGLEYQLTATIQKLNNKISVLHGLDKKINVTMYLSESLNKIAPLIRLNQLPQLAPAVIKTIEKINTQTLGMVNFTRAETTDKEQINALAQEHNLMVLSWPAVPEQNISEGFGAAGLIIDYNDQTTTLPLIRTVEIPIIGTTYQMVNPADLEDKMMSVIEKMIGINKDIGVLQSHGALSLLPDQAARMQGRPDNSLNAFNLLVSKRYTIKPIDLKKGPIPDGLNCLVIPRPLEKFSDYELFQIDQALMKGTNIAFFSDSFNQIMPPRRGIPPIYTPIDTGFEKLLNHYGVSITKAYVLDKQCYKANVPPEMGGGEQDIYYYPLLKNDQINTEPEFMHNLKGLVAGQISPLELIKENIDTEKITAVNLLTSSDRSWLMKDNINLNPVMIHPPKNDDAFDSYAMAYVLSGQFTSFFKDKPVPEKTEDKPDDAKETSTEDVKKTPLKEERNQPLPPVTAENIKVATGKPARLLVLASSQMIQDTMVDPDGRTMNATFILNAIDHLNNEDQIASLRAKQQTLNPIEETSAALRAAYKAFNIIGLPLLVVLFGLGVLAKRTARKKKLATRFND
jgi:ABC-2 type transport system permease protein